MALSDSLKNIGTSIAAAYRRYGEWLVSISWKRFVVLSILLLIVSGILSNIPPFSWDIATRTSRVPSSRNVDINIDENGVRIKPKKKNSTAPEITIDESGVHIKRKTDGSSPQEIIVDEKGVRMRRNEPPAAPTPPAPPAAPSSPDSESFSDSIHREVIDPIKRDIAEMRRQAQENAAEAKRGAEQARRDAEQARRDAEQARRDAEQARHDAMAREADARELASDIRREVIDSLSDLSNEERVVHTRLGDFLPQLAFLWIMLSAAIKIAYARTVKAEAKAA
ncbi:MAG: hypothetical protein JOZ85_08575, partial [Betaproteobacteria bacterium]|nr:hypothetical protein [Betaproteobacteria bacterium]